MSEAIIPLMPSCQSAAFHACNMAHLPCQHDQKSLCFPTHTDMPLVVTASALSPSPIPRKVLGRESNSEHTELHSQELAVIWLSIRDPARLET